MALVAALGRHHQLEQNMTRRSTALGAVRPLSSAMLPFNRPKLAGSSAASHHSRGLAGVS